MELVQADLDRCAREWNQHKVRASRNAESPPGKPDLMYYLPHMYGRCCLKLPIKRNSSRAKQFQKFFSMEVGGNI